MRRAMIVLCVLAGAVATAQPQANPRQQPGAMVHIFASEQRDLYDGHFVISANRIYHGMHFFGMEITWKQGTYLDTYEYIWSIM